MTRQQHALFVLGLHQGQAGRVPSTSLPRVSNSSRKVGNSTRLAAEDEHEEKSYTRITQRIEIPYFSHFQKGKQI
jgi:hypothetical protein